MHSPLTHTLRRAAAVAALLTALIAPIGCDTFDCPLNNTVEAGFTFYVFDADGNPKSVTLLDTLTVTAGATDSVLINKQYKMTGIYLPMSYDGETDTLSLLFTDEENRKVYDTIWVAKRNIPHYESPSCPSTMYHHITDVQYTTRTLDCVELINPNVNYDDKENIRIYFRSAD